RGTVHLFIEPVTGHSEFHGFVYRCHITCCDLQFEVVQPGWRRWLLVADGNSTANSKRHFSLAKPSISAKSTRFLGSIIRPKSQCFPMCGDMPSAKTSGWSSLCDHTGSMAKNAYPQRISHLLSGDGVLSRKLELVRFSSSRGCPPTSESSNS